MNDSRRKKKRAPVEFPANLPADLAERIARLAQPALAACGLELVDVETIGGQGRTTLRVVLDSSDGVGVEDCAKFSRLLGDILDVEDPIEANYVLEVSSPGLDRPLKKPAHFAWAQGKDVRITLRQPLEGRNVFRGRLVSFDEQTNKINLEVDDGELVVDLDELARARLDVDPFGRTAG